ncbi:Serine/threonine kinase-like domain-containing protein STKLD1 [Geodia barretti]|nr:Serine/threonine kinase-like domain-containing protein STKLD1 [Geodia barretti]
MISEGPLGPSLLVKEKTTGEKCVVKQVECTDYTQAMLAYNQALQLQRLGSHESVCSYRHFFVQWEREAHAVYLCTVTPYQELGSLSSFIEAQREKKGSIDEEVLKNWTAQLVEGLCHSHSLDLLHRNIKLSNIFLSSPTSLLLGDFTVPVVMENMKEVASKRGGSLQWLAPEEMEKRGEGEGERGSEKGRCVVPGMCTYPVSHLLLHGCQRLLRAVPEVTQRSQCSGGSSG